ncbi:DUF3990 domain-containing protein [Clostridium sp. UBA1652]|uniref:DUF3990 domain-containing protein n=1 Tax=Clostridium sp. UBA1652 TaxID=1946348 RepID=UPI00257CC94D|nr:DUF3990 domain-containing protein [Clostridium sp. UBA1652]
MGDKFLKYLNKDRWYHATTLAGWKNICSQGILVDYNKGNELDFGYAFYVTPDKKQAEYFITKLLQYQAIEPNLGLPTKDIEDTRIPVVIEFEFSPIEWFNDKKYKFRILDKYDDEFAKFVYHNRTKNVDGTSHHNFDFIFGVMSDSNPIILLQKLKNGEITEENVLEGLKKTTSSKQLSIHNQKICDIIKVINVYSVNTGKELDINDYYNK